MTPRFDVHGYLEAWRRRDLDRILEFHAESFVMEEPIGGRVGRGREYLRGFLGTDMEIIDELELEPRIVLQTDDQAALLVRVHATYARDHPMPEGVPIRLAGKTIVFDIAIFLDVEMGRISHETWIYDVSSIFAQMGLQEGEVERLLREGPLASYSLQWPRLRASREA